MAISPDGRKVYVTNQMAGTVTPISTRTDRAGKPIKVGFMASMITVTPDGTTAYVGTANTVVPFSTATGAVGKAIGVAPRGFMGAISDMAIAPDGKTVYVATWESAVILISTRTGRAGKPIRPGRTRLLTLGGENFIRMTPDGETAYVGWDNTVVPVYTDSRTAGRPIRVRQVPYNMAITPDGNTAYVLDQTSGVVAINTA
jgi:YVTN family beta-propeller protein